MPLPRLALILFLAFGVAAATLAAPRAATAAPCLLTEATRVQTFNVNLDGDRAAERIDVFNFDGAATPVTQFQVCDRVGGDLVLGQRTTVTVSPGSRDSGLRHAWVGDLNRDGRIEIAVRDFLTPSAGEVLSIYRQAAFRGRRFSTLQRITGDVTSLTRHAHGAATISVQLRANHARDGKAHTERWSFSRRTRRWICRTDCGGRAG